MTGGRVAGLLLAAGAGRRYGRPKALLEHAGRLLVEHGLSTLDKGGCAPVLVVLGAACDEVRQRADLSAAIVVANPDWPSGMGSSLVAGLTALDRVDPAVEAVAVLLVDTPGVTPVAVRRIVGYADPGALVVAEYHGSPGHPVLLGRAHWAGVLASATGDIGARTYLDEHKAEVVRVPCDDVAAGEDLDVPVEP
jgi:CTP:molybdopterin cytidylyltransferase MocA